MPDPLADALRRGPFHVALRTAIETRGLSLARLRAHLARLDVPVAESTLSYWQRGLRHPDAQHALAAVRALETVLGLPVDSLVVLIGPTRRGKPRKQATSFAELIVAGPITRELLRELGVDPEQVNADLEARLITERITMRADRSQGLVRTRIVSQARAPGIDRYVAVYHSEPGGDADQVRVSADDGCRVGRVRRKAHGVVFELVFDRVLTQDETVVLGFTIEDNTHLPCPGYYRLFRARSGPFLLQYELETLPARLVQEVRVSDARPPTLARELYCDRSGVVSAYYPGMEPGIAGIALEWE